MAVVHSAASTGSEIVFTEGSVLLRTVQMASNMRLRDLGVQAH